MRLKNEKKKIYYFKSNNSKNNLMNKSLFLN